MIVVLLLIFLLFTAGMLTGKLPALLAIPAMAIAMAAAVGADLSTVLDDILVEGSVLLAPAYIVVFFGGMLGQVMVLTGVAERIVKIAAEFGGDRPMLVVFSMVVASALLFTSLSGLGAVIMVGTLVLPIMASVGVPRPLAAASFIMAFGTGYVMNPSLWKIIEQILNVPIDEVYSFALKLLAVNAVVTTAFLLYYGRKMLLFATCAAEAEPGDAAEQWERPRQRLPWISFATPIVPLALIMLLKWPVIPAFVAGALFGVLTTQPRRMVPLLSRASIRGLEEAAPAIILMVGIGMMVKMSQLPQVGEALRPILMQIEGISPLAYIFGFTLLAPLVLYRGPLNPFGLGIGIYLLLNSFGVLPSLALLALLLSLIQVQSVCDPTNTQNVWVANFSEIPVEKITRMTLLFQMGVAFIGLCLGAWLYLR